MERVYAIRTPEMVRFDFRLAGPASRGLAWALDMGILAGFLVVFSLVACLVSAALAFTIQTPLGVAVWIAGFFAIYHGYFVVLEWRWSGRTFGKRALGLRVIQANGTRLAPFQAVARNLVRAVDSLFPFYTLGLGSLLATRRLQRLGDLVAGTIVVREDREAVLPKTALLAEDPSARLRTGPADPDPSAELRAGLGPRMARRLSKDERELLVDAARRADEIDLAVRGPLFERLSRHFAGRLGLARDPNVSDEKLVQNLARALSVHEREGAVGGL